MANGGRDREDIADRTNAGESVDRDSTERGCSSQGIGLAERLTEALVEDGDADLLLQHTDRDDRVIQWLQALDLQVIGACRADERLKPLLKLNASSGMAEDLLLAHLSQHFEPAEVGMLARCFCMPLVSIRVGKIDMRGTLLCPTPTRGNLNLTLLPTSDLRLSLVGDDGHVERIVTLSNNDEGSSITVEEISQDTSGRSFVMKIAGGKEFFFWCSEKAKLLGVELLGKMKDLLDRRPSVAELTGIDESRLECFATYLRAYLMGSNVCNTQVSVSISPSVSSVTTLGDMNRDSQPSSVSASKPAQSLSSSSQPLKVSSLYQATLSPRLSSFKEALPRSFLCSRSNATREKLKKWVENPPTAVESSSNAFQLPSSGTGISTSNSGDVVKSEGSSVKPPFGLGFLESLGNLIPSSLSSVPQVPFAAQPIFSPYYCWCPPGSSSSQRTPSAPNLLPPNDSLLLPLPPPLLQPLPSTPSISLADLPPLDFPAFLPDPLVCLPKPTSQQIPTFTPLICDSIVHIPVIDMCSAGQGYLVSAGSTVSTTISPLHPKLNDSVVEEGARETLRLLLSGSDTTSPPSLCGVLPLPAIVLADEISNSSSNNMVSVSGSRGLYCATQDIPIFSSFANSVGLLSSPQRGADGDCSDDKGEGNANANAGDSCDDPK